MIDELRAMAIFAEVVKMGSFRAAAKSLNLSPSVVSYHISQLEKQVSTALVYRSTRKLSLSSEGEELYKHIQNMMLSAQQGIERITQQENSINGKITITLPTALIKAPITAVIAGFAKQHSNVSLNISYTDKREDLIANGIDVAIRAGELPDSSLKARQIGEIKRLLVCSPSYYQQMPEPIAPQNLQHWQWVKLSMLPSHRVFIHKKYTQAKVEFDHQITVDNVDAMTQMSVLGCGLSTPADYQVEELIKQNKLMHVLPDWQVIPKPIYAVWPANVSEHSLVKRLLNFIVDAI